jgi:hypothetical protein
MPLTFPSRPSSQVDALRSEERQDLQIQASQYYTMLQKIKPKLLTQEQFCCGFTMKQADRAGEAKGEAKGAKPVAEAPAAEEAGVKEEPKPVKVSKGQGGQGRRFQTGNGQVRGGVVGGGKSAKVRRGQGGGAQGGAEAGEGVQGGKGSPNKQQRGGEWCGGRAPQRQRSEQEGRGARGKRLPSRRSRNRQRSARGMAVVMKQRAAKEKAAVKC